MALQDVGQTEMKKLIGVELNRDDNTHHRRRNHHNMSQRASNVRVVLQRTALIPPHFCEVIESQRLIGPSAANAIECSTSYGSTTKPTSRNDGPR